MNCQEVMEQMQRQLDHDLNENEELLLHNHIHQCRDCAAMFDRLKLLSAELSSLPKVVPGYSLVDAIMPQLDQLDRLESAHIAKSAAESSLARRKPRDRKWPSFRAAGSVVAAGIVAGLFIMFYNPNSGSRNDSAMMESASYSSAHESRAMDAPTAGTMASTPSSGSENLVEVTTEGIDHRAVKKDAEEQSVIQEPQKLQDNSAGADNGGSNSSSSDGSSGSSEAEAIEPVTDAIKGVQNKENGDSANGLIAPQAEDADHIASDYLGIASVVSSIEEISPNGEYTAVAHGYIISIYKIDDNSIVWETTRKNGELTALSWSEDSSQLKYEIHIENGAYEEYSIDMATGVDSKSSY